MRLYVISLAVGILAGLIYGLLGVRSPAPPVVALVGLLGMLVGEQVVPAAKRLVWVKSAVAMVQSHSFPKTHGKDTDEPCNEKRGT